MHPDAERISSYLDGELDAEARAAVEQLLLDDPSARELFSDLRQVRVELKALPQRRLPDAFADQVMRAAERLMLLGPEEPAAESTYTESTTSTPQVAGRTASWRSTAWFVSGAAAAVLLMLAWGPWSRPTNRPLAVLGGDPPERVAGSDDPIPVLPTAHRSPVAEPADSADSAQEVASNAGDDSPHRESPVPPPAETTPAPIPATAQTDVERQPPFGWVVWSNISLTGISEAHFDNLLRKRGITVRGSANDRAGAEDVVYVEASPDQLDAVFMEMREHKTVYRSTVMQFSLGVFRDPALWSEILDAAKPLEGENDVRASVDGGDVHKVEGARAAHITPDVTPARPLQLDEANPQMLEAFENAYAAAPTEMDVAPPRKPVVDDGLVRALFVFRPVSADDAATPTP